MAKFNQTNPFTCTKRPPRRGLFGQPHLNRSTEGRWSDLPPLFVFRSSRKVSAQGDDRGRVRFQATKVEAVSDSSGLPSDPRLSSRPGLVAGGFAEARADSSLLRSDTSARTCRTSVLFSLPTTTNVNRLSIFLLALVGFFLFPAATSGQTPCTSGSAGGYACDGVDLMARIPLSTFTSPGNSAPSSGNDIWGWTDDLTGREYALVGLNNGTAFVDVTAPSSPVYLGKLPTATSNSLWRDIKTVGDFAFIVSEASNHGMQVFDLKRLRNVANPPVTFTADTRFTGFGNAHNIVADDASGFVYAVGTGSCSGGLYMVNVSSPLTPSFAGCYSGDGYTHDAQCVVYNGPDTQHQGRQICVASNTDTVTIVDVTNKNAPVQLDRAFYPNPSYTHQGWFTADQRYFVVNDESDGNSSTPTRTIVMDLLNLDSAEFSFFYSGTSSATDHNLYIHNGRVFQSNYAAGLRILDASGIGGGALPEIAYFDTYPANNSHSFNGQWSNYPFFSSGVIVASDQSGGLFVLTLAGGAPIALTVNTVINGAGTKGRAELDWTPFDGSTDKVEVLRNGVVVKTTLDDGGFIYRENPVPPGNVAYQVCDRETGDCSNEVTVSFLGSAVSEVWATEDESEASVASETSNAVAELPGTPELHAAYPNPFNPSAILNFSLPETSVARLAVYDATGREVALLVDGTIEAGSHGVVFDGSDLPSGVYLVHFTAGGGFTQTQRLTLLK